MRRLIARLAALLLATCRTAYCWMFFVFSVAMFRTVYTNFSRMARSHSVGKAEAITYGIMAIYSVVMAIAWWMIFRGKPALRRWAIATNLIIIFFFLPAFLPALVSGEWRGVLKAQLGWWPEIVVGIVGIIVFSIPYHGWRHNAQIPVDVLP